MYRWILLSLRSQKLYSSAGAYPWSVWNPSSYHTALSYGSHHPFCTNDLQTMHHWHVRQMVLHREPLYCEVEPNTQNFDMVVSQASIFAFRV